MKRLFIKENLSYRDKKGYILACVTYFAIGFLISFLVCHFF